MDAATKAYVALTTSGTDTLLMAADHALRRELNRRIRDDLITLGIVQNGPAVTIADGTAASHGDLIICTRNDHTVEAGEPGRTLANGDLLRIDAVTRQGLLVRRALDADPRTGQRRWTGRAFRYAGYRDAELGYAVTDHAAQGRTVHTGLAVITGTEDRQHAYVALTRGTDANIAYVFTVSPKRADPVPGPRPAAEPARYDKIDAERPGVPAPATPPAPPGTALGVLSAVQDHDGQQHSATQTRQALADADHLAVLHAIWTAETTPAREQHYQDLLQAALPPGHRAEPGHQARWLWRTLRAAELAGLDPARVLADAIAERDLAGARRYPQRHRRPPPLPPWLPRAAAIQAVVRPGSRHRRPRTPCVRHRDRRDDGCPQGPNRRARRRAFSALGSEYPRTGASASAGTTGLAAAGQLHRRIPGTVRLRSPRRPDRARAHRGRPGQAGGLYEALAALGPVDGPDLRGMPDGTLLHLRDTYPVETAWGPMWVGDELRRVRVGAREAGLAAARADAEATAAERSGREEAAPRHRVLAASYRALHEAYRERESVFAGVMADRADWEAATRAATPPRGSRRRRTAPSTSGAALYPTSFGRTAGRHRRPARRAHPDRRTGRPRGGPVDQRPGCRAPDVRRPARRTAEPDGPLRRPRLRRPRPGVPVLVRPLEGCDLAAAEAGDPPLGPGPGARPGPRRRQGSGRLTVARCILEAER